MRLGLIILICTSSIVVTSASARAQVFVSPHFGAHFAGGTVDSRTIAVGGSAGAMAGLIGFEVDYAFSPDFFPDSHPSSSLHVVGDLSTVMVNIVAGNFARNDIGGAYVSGGIGVVQILADEPDGRFDARGSDIGYNLGGGAIGFFNPTVGLRGDVRYFRNNRRDELISSRSTHHDAIRFRAFGFFRATVGLVFKF